MPFQPDQMSPESLRRLVKLQRRALAKVLGQKVPQHQAQEIVAQTLGHANWHDALARVQANDLPKTNASVHPLSSLPISADLDHRPVRITPVVAGEPDRKVMDFLRHAVREGMQDVADDLNVPHFRDLLTKAPDGFDRQWAPLNLPTMADVSSDRLGDVFCWLLESPTRLEAFSNHDQWADFCNRVRRDPSLRSHRETLLEKAWPTPSLFKKAAPLIPTDQVWPWLHRAARSRRLLIMDFIHECHERAIGSEPFHALCNAVFARDDRQVQSLIEAQCRRYGLSVKDEGGERRGKGPVLAVAAPSLPTLDQAVRSKRSRSPK